jgi:hypothetical protein
MPPKSYFGYVEREADSYVNWADVGRTITNTVDEIDRVRTEKKAAIDAAYKEELQRINDKPMGQKDDVNKWTIDMAYNAAENLKIQNNLLKSGKLAVKDYAIYLQNTSDSIKNLYGTVEKIQTAFQERLDRQANEENQKIEMWDGEDLEQYGKLTDLGANFNINGNLTFSRLETVTEDGKTITRAKPGSENLLSVNQLAGAVSTKYNKYDYLKDADDFIKRLGEGITAYRIEGSELQAGSITQITDKSGELNLQKVADLGIVDPAEIERLKGVVSEYAKAEEEYIKAALNPKYNKSSILTEELGYTPTDNVEEAKKNPKLMLVQRETDGTITPIIPEGSDQDKEAREFLRGQYRQMIDKKLNIDTYTEVGRQKQEPPRASAAEIELGQSIEEQIQLGKDLQLLKWGNDTQRDSILKKIRNYTNINSEGTYFDEVTGDFVMTVVGKPPTRVALSEKNPDGSARKDSSGNYIPSKISTRDFVVSIGDGVYGKGAQEKYLLQNIEERPTNLNLNLSQRREKDKKDRLSAIESEQKKLSKKGSSLEDRNRFIDLEIEKNKLLNTEETSGTTGGGGTTKTTTKPGNPR